VGDEGRTSGQQASKKLLPEAGGDLTSPPVLTNLVYYAETSFVYYVPVAVSLPCIERLERLKAPIKAR
jgi:hypothetical protein